MTYHALVVDDNPSIVEDVKDRLESLGHTCDCVHCMDCGRKRLTAGSYSYVLLDLEIPVKYGRKSRLVNGLNMLQEIRSTRGFELIPIIIMTSHGHDSPDLAIEVLRGNGATDFVKKSAGLLASGTGTIATSPARAMACTTAHLHSTVFDLAAERTLLSTRAPLSESVITVVGASNTSPMALKNRLAYATS